MKTQAMGEGTRDRADFGLCGFVQKRAYITVHGTAAQAQPHTRTSSCSRPLLATRPPRFGRYLPGQNTAML